MRSLVSAFAILALLSGCATPTVPDADLARISKVGVISTMGDTFHGISIGTTVFNNSYFSADVPEWNIDAYIADHVQRAVTQGSPRSAVVIPRGQIGPTTSVGSRERAALEMGASRGVDTVLIVTPVANDNLPFFRRGYGLFERSMFGRGYRCVYAWIGISVLDVRQKKDLAYNSTDNPCPALAGKGRDDDLAIKDSFDLYTEAEKAEIKRRLELWITQSLDETLRELKLAP